MLPSRQDLKGIRVELRARKHFLQPLEEFCLQLEAGKNTAIPQPSPGCLPAEVRSEITQRRHRGIQFQVGKIRTCLESS